MKAMVVGLDLDGTLINSLDLTASWITKAASNALGQPVSEALVRSHFGDPEPRIFRNLLKESTAEKAFSLYKELLILECKQMKLYAGVEKTLSYLRQQGIFMGLITSRGTWATEEILRQHSLSSYFPLVLTGEHVKKVKPDPEGILKMCTHFGVSPAAFLYLGDSPSDVLAAESAGAIGYQALWASGVKPYGSRHLHSFEEIRSLL